MRIAHLIEESRQTRATAAICRKCHHFKMSLLVIEFIPEAGMKEKMA